MGWDTQSHQDGVWVGQHEGFDRDTGREIINVVVDEKGGDHQHYGFDKQTGQEIFGNIDIRR